MKKLVLAATLAIAIVGCKKEAPVTPVLSDGKTTEKLVADLIQKTDKNLYTEVYGEHDPNQRLPHVGVKIIHGIFVITSSGPSSGTCLPHPTNPCMIIISAFTESGTILPGVTITFSREEGARLIVNKPNPVVETVTEVTTEPTAEGTTNVTVVN